jgi:DNA-binding beta-propeller fold protein YncE
MKKGVKMKLWTKSFCIIISGLSILISSCIFKPTPAVQSYYLYAGNWDYDEVFIIDTEDNVVVDTLEGFGHVWDIAVTPGGNRLYVCTREGMYNAPGAIYSVDLITKEKNIIQNSAADVYISPSGMPLVIAHIPNDTLAQVGFIDTLTDQISFIDSLNISDYAVNYQKLVFHPNDSLFYTWTNEQRLFAYNYQRKEIVKKYNSESLSKNMEISSDGSFIYFAYKTLDVLKDSIIAIRDGYYEGSIALSHCEEKIYLTDTGYPGFLDYHPSGTVRIFESLGSIESGVIDINNDSKYRNTPTDRMKILKNGQKAYIGTPKEIFEVNLVNNEVIDVIKFDDGRVWLKPLVIGEK